MLFTFLLETASDEWVSAHTSQSVTLADSRLSRDGDPAGGAAAGGLTRCCVCERGEPHGEA